MAPSATSSRRFLYGAIGTGAVLAGSLAYVGLADPHRPGFLFPVCPFKALTGWNCPGCGGLRMTHDVLHGDFAAAVVDNVFVLVGLPQPAIVVIAVAAITWTVVRNLPGFPLVPTLLGG
jgi:hypothetical protein